MDLLEIMCEDVDCIHLIWSIQDPFEGCCDRGNQSSRSIKDKRFLNQFLPDNFGVAATLQTCILEVLGMDLDLVAGYPQ